MRLSLTCPNYKCIYCFLYCSHDHRGELYRVNWSHFGRDSHLDCDIDNIEELYKAMRTFDDIMNDPKNHIRLKMQPGKERVLD